MDLYRIEGADQSLSQIVESEFLSSLDNNANTALQKLIKGEKDFSDVPIRSQWTRFLMSIRYRHPSAVTLLKRNTLDIWNDLIHQSEPDYQAMRKPGDPPNLRAYSDKRDPTMPFKTALQTMINAMNHPDIGTAIMRMNWSRIEISNTPFSFLTSDTPLIMHAGLASREAVIVLPIGPEAIFAAANNADRLTILSEMTSTDLVTMVNSLVVGQASLFVWGKDNNQLRFVQNRFGNRPMLPILTEAQTVQLRQDALSRFRQNDS